MDRAAAPVATPGGALGPEPLTYAGAGVDIDAADRAVDAMRSLVASTTGRPGVLGAIGGFGGMFEVPSGYRRPVLVSSTDGVGTKMAVAMATARFDTVGIDLVAMCVDDLVCCGATPLFFLDYQLLGRVDPDQVRALMTGIAAGCRTAGAAIVGGELAEHPGLLAPGEVDLAGFAVGIVEHDRIIDGPARCQVGDALLGLPSPGLRSNGYSLARRALLEVAGRHLDAPAWAGAPATLADELLRPSVIYAPAISALLADPGPGSDAAPSGAAGAAAPGAAGAAAPGAAAPGAAAPGLGATGAPAAVGAPWGREAMDAAEPVSVHAIAHITGGGLPGNVPRVLPPHLDAVVEPGRWSRPRIFAEIQAAGSIAEAEMRRVFNLGIGMVLALAPVDVPDAIDILAGAGQEPVVIGRLVEGSGHLRFMD